MALETGVHSRLTLTGPAARLRGVVRVPGDKSISHRAILLGALAHGPSRISGVLRAGVTEAMLDGLLNLGVDAGFAGQDDMVIVGGSWRPPDRELNCGNSGTILRLLLGALAPQPFSATLAGSPRLMQRPMGRVVEPLLKMGARIEGAGQGHQPPLRVQGGSLRGVEHHMSVASAQVKSALLIAGLFADGATTVHEPAPSRDHTERMLRNLGVSITAGNGSVRVEAIKSPLRPFHLHVPGDFSSAAFLFAAAALVPGSSVRVAGVGVNPTRTGILDALRSMGASVRVEGLHLESGEPVADVEVGSARLRGVTVSGADVVRMIDEFPALAVAMTQAEGESLVRDAAELKVKESDRIDGLVHELRRLGARIDPLPDGFRVHGPARLRGGRVDAHGDHRLAMALAVAGLAAEGKTVVTGAACIDESFPGFQATLAALGVDVQ